MSAPRTVLDLLLFGGSLYLLWGAYRTRKELAAWRALSKQTLQVVREKSGMLTEALDLAAKQQRRITYCEAVLGALGLQPPPEHPKRTTTTTATKET